MKRITLLFLVVVLIIGLYVPVGALTVDVTMYNKAIGQKDKLFKISTVIDWLVTHPYYAIYYHPKDGSSVDIELVYIVFSKTPTFTSSDIVHVGVGFIAGGSTTSANNTQVTFSVVSGDVQLGCAKLATNTRNPRPVYYIQNLSTAKHVDTDSLNPSYDWVLSTVGDKTALQAIINTAESLQSNGYTPNSWTNLQSKLTSANAANDSLSISQANIDYAANNLQSAINSLVILADKTALQAVINSANLLNSSEYTSESWTNLQSKLTAAKNVNNNANATQTQVNTAADNLQAAIDALVIHESADKSSLQTLINIVNTMQSGIYTLESWTNLQDRLLSAVSVNDDVAATQFQVDAAVDNLQAAIYALEYYSFVITTALEEMLIEIDSLDKDLYTTQSWQSLQDVSSFSRLLLTQSGITQSQVDDALSELVSAYDALELIPFDIAPLESLILQAESLSGGDYTLDTWRVMRNVLNDVITALPNISTQSQVAHWVTLLSDAIEQLEKIPSLPPKPIDMSRLESLVIRGDSLVEDDYTPESWQSFEHAHSAARSVLFLRMSYTQEYIDNLSDNLLSAINGLVYATVSYVPTTPSGHRYLIDGVLPDDLSIAETAIFENISWGRDAGLWAFSLMLIVFVGLKVVRSIFGMQGESRYIDYNSPSENSGSVIDNVSGRKHRFSDSDKHYGKYI